MTDTTAGHTPGPWILAKNENWPFGIKVFSKSVEGIEILSQHAYCHSSTQNTRKENEDGIGFKHGKDREEAKRAIAEQDANAALIAAAPDMLEALKHAQRLYDYDKTISAAIAKAEGK